MNSLPSFFSTPAPSSEAWKKSAVLHAILILVWLGIEFWKAAPSRPVEINLVEISNPRPLEAEKPVTLAPKKAPPPPITAPPPPAVFGVARNALTDESSSVSVKQGNTVAKAPDTKELNPNDPDALPIPTEEYLVSQMPQLRGELRIPYPEEARKKRIQGTVTLEILIDDQGKVRDATLVQGIEPQDYGLNAAALEGAKKLEFSPARMGDKSVAVKIQINHRFVLEK